jgi:hypothetical protein
VDLFAEYISNRRTESLFGFRNSHGAHLGVFVALMVEHSSTSFLLLASMNQR